MLPYMASFSYVFDEIFIKVSYGPEKILAWHFHLGIVHFTKCSIINVWQCFKYVSVYLHISTLCNPCIFSTLPYSETWHILSQILIENSAKCWPGLFRTHVIRRYSAIFRHIQNLLQCLHMQKLCLLGVLEYLELFHYCIPKHIQNPVIFTKIYDYSQP